MSYEPELAEQFEDLGKQGLAARLGMWLFLGSEILLFAGLFALYTSYRAMYGADFIKAAAHNDPEAPLFLSVDNAGLCCDPKIVHAHQTASMLMATAECRLEFTPEVLAVWMPQQKS